MMHETSHNRCEMKPVTVGTAQDTIMGWIHVESASLFPIHWVSTLGSK